MNLADQIFKTNIEKILSEGQWDDGPRPSYIDGTPANSKFITQVFETYDLSKNEIPLTSLRPIAIKSGIKEIFWIYQDQDISLANLRDKYGITWWDSWESKDVPGTIGTRYGYTIGKHNQINNLLKGLKENPYSRRHIMTMWDWEHFRRTDGLYPCAYETLWSVRGDQLDMTLIQRSSDYLVAGHVNKMQYVALQMMVAHHCGYKVGKFSHLVQNLHIYDRHIEQAKELLKREPHFSSQPMLILAAAEDKTFFDITLDDFILEQYYPIKPQLTFELAI